MTGRERTWRILNAVCGRRKARALVLRCAARSDRASVGGSSVAARAGILLASVVLSLAVLSDARTADAPVIDAVIDAASGAVLWRSSEPATSPTLKPGQALILRGHGFGPGPVTAASRGLGPPAGGLPPADGSRSVIPSGPELSDRELSKIQFGNVRAMERDLSSYRARIDLASADRHVLRAQL